MFILIINIPLGYFAVLLVILILLVLKVLGQMKIYKPKLKTCPGCNCKSAEVIYTGKHFFKIYCFNCKNIFLIKNR